MNSPIPFGSDIRVDTHYSFTQITIPEKKGYSVRILLGAFLIFWLSGWFFGFVAVFGEVTNGQGSGFGIVWLIFWAIAGAFAAFMLFRVVRPPRPEKFLLNTPNLSFDTGIQALRISISFKYQMDIYKTLFARRKTHEFDPEEIKTIKLRETDSGNRLTIDVGYKRLELAKTASEIEREWLFQFLCENYPEMVH